ncbi:hypothetical protein PG997_004745 [Apiospora hydei]|uniref:Uncharacterized protein n=1 Tax=Apiospora hydei TaxID=1337664 RepID=A0ABR1X2Z3_9PEZI
MCLHFEVQLACGCPTHRNRTLPCDDAEAGRTSPRPKAQRQTIPYWCPNDVCEHLAKKRLMRQLHNRQEEAAERELQRQQQAGRA